MENSYQLIDSGNQLKWERFGAYTLIRPCSQALWKPQEKESLWAQADARFSREKGNVWEFKKKMPEEWVCEINGVSFKVSLTDFGHLGVFPEHSLLWDEMRSLIQKRGKGTNILNLFAYSGGATLAAAQAGASVCHLDASKAMVTWARENATLNHLEKAPIRWIVDDVFKFLKREIKRGIRYEGIILDPPSFGRGNKGEVFKIEQDIHPLLDLCVELFSDAPLFLSLTTHTPGMTPLAMDHLLRQKMKKHSGKIETGEMRLPSEKGLDIPSGSYAKWVCQ